MEKEDDAGKLWLCRVGREARPDNGVMVARQQWRRWFEASKSSSFIFFPDKGGTMEKKLLLMSTDDKYRFNKIEDIFCNVVDLRYTTAVNRANMIKKQYYIYAYVTKPEEETIRREVENLDRPFILKKA